LDGTASPVPPISKFDDHRDPVVQPQAFPFSDIRRYPIRVDYCRYCSGGGLVKNFNQAPHLKWS
jgi:hypothetical protein